MRSVESEDSQGQVRHATLRFVVVHSSQLAQQQTQTSTRSQAKEAETMTHHLTRVEAQGFACVAEAAAAIVHYEGHGQGRRGRRPRPWRYHAVAYRVVADTRRTRWGRPAKTDPPPVEPCYPMFKGSGCQRYPETVIKRSG
jgi:hypothetical protein